MESIKRKLKLNGRPIKKRSDSGKKRGNSEKKIFDSGQKRGDARLRRERITD